jgi:uncharacterized repeat protein (TIGR01451 family)
MPAVLLVLSFALVQSTTVAAPLAVTIHSPADGDVVTAKVCPFSACTGTFQFEVEVTGAPMERVIIHLINDSGPGNSFDQPLCLTDPIEHESCPDPPQTFMRPLTILEGEWTVHVEVVRDSGSETTPPIHLTVLPHNETPPGTVALAAVTPNEGSPPILLRDATPGDPALYSKATAVTITGDNLADNPFLEVYVAPKPFNETTYTQESALPTSDWCLFQATILDQGTNGPGDDFLVVEVPDIPLETPTLCGFTPGPSGSIFSKEWRWLVHDKWIREERVHAWWAIPSPRQGDPAQDAPPFQMAKSPYPLIDGFGFDNEESDPKYYEFLTVFGNNAYLCVGAFGVCATRLPDPLYHILWWPIYNLAVGSTGGSCNGIAATSLRFAREELQPEDFITEVHYPAGFEERGEPATYEDSNFCTPVCSPPKPDNLWATIRMNHGVQISREFLLEIIDTLGEAIFDPNDVTSIKGVPNATLERVRANPRGYVLCFFQPGKGHCVTPYRVAGNKIMIYDNNEPLDDDLYIEIAGGDYDYPARSKDPNHGNAIMAFPIGIWQNGRHLLGLSDLVALIDGDVVEFLYMIAVGSGDMVVTNEAGGRWGWEDDGTFTDSLTGAVTIPPLGPQDEPSHAMPLLVAMNQPAPTVQMNADGGSYNFLTGAGGHLLQIEADAPAGDKDQIQLGYEAAKLASMQFTPQHATTSFVPRVGLAIDEEESALFHWLGLAVPGGESVSFGADKNARAVSYHNDTGTPTHHLLALDYGSGAGESAGRMLYGPFDVPAGASQRVLLANWPEVSEVVSELDLDGDGTADVSTAVPGRPGEMPTAQGVSADLMLAQSASQNSVLPGQAVTFTTTVTNAGPENATGVTLVDAFSTTGELSAPAITGATCAIENGVSCDLGTLAAGATLSITYVATPTVTATLSSAAFVFGNEGDPDPTNNSVVVAVDVANRAQESILLPLIER